MKKICEILALEVFPRFAERQNLVSRCGRLTVTVTAQRSKIRGVDRSIRIDNHHALHRVLQLAHVAWPIGRFERCDGLRGVRAYILSELAIKVVEKEQRKRHDILTPLA